MLEQVKKQPEWLVSCKLSMTFRSWLNIWENICIIILSKLSKKLWGNTLNLNNVAQNLCLNSRKIRFLLKLSNLQFLIIPSIGGKKRQQNVNGSSKSCLSDSSTWKILPSIYMFLLCFYSFFFFFITTWLPFCKNLICLTRVQMELDDSAYRESF